MTLSPDELAELRRLDARDAFRQEAEHRIADETEAIKAHLDLTEDDFLHMPWASLDGLVRGIPAAKLWYIVMASGNGKTLFMHSLIDSVLARNEPVYAVTTETSPDQFRLMMAASAIGIMPGDILTGEYLRWPNVDQVRRQLIALVEARSVAHNRLLQFCQAPGLLTAQKVRHAAHEAHLMGAYWFIIDHADYCALEDSNAVNAALQDAKLRYGHRIIASSQMNQVVFQQEGRLALATVPREDHVKYGSVKKENADGMIGGSRVLRPDLDKATLDKFKAGTIKLLDIVVPGCARFTVMKNRLHQQYVGASITLDVVNGRLAEPGFAERGGHHGIRTNRDF